jgi:hypothetical protein
VPCQKPPGTYPGRRPTALSRLKGANFVGLTGLNNGAARIDAVDWGIVNGEVSGASGHLDMDDFSSNR